MAIHTRRAQLLGLLLVLAVIGWAGLRPFVFDRPNRAAWTEGRAGLRFDGGGMALSSGDAEWDTSRAPSRFELELVLRPETVPVASEHTVFFVLVDELPTPCLVLYQDAADLVVADRVTNPDGERWYNDFRVRDVFVPGEARRVELVDGPRPRISVDGDEAALASGFPIPIGRVGEPLRGRVLLGSSPDGRRPWRGELLEWSLRDGGAVVTQLSGGVQSGLELELPARYRSLRPPVALVPSDPRDVLLNLLGFMPLGYLLALLLGGRARSLLWVACAGFALSLAIELAQSLTIERVSSLTDLALNTLGTWIGAWVAGARLRRR